MNQTCENLSQISNGIGNEKEAESEVDVEVKDTDENLKVMSNEESFGWILVFIIFLDMFLFMVYTNIASPVCITVLEVLFLNYLARMWDVCMWKEIFW